MAVSGHSQGRVVAEHQPAKLAAFEATSSRGRRRSTCSAFPTPGAAGARRRDPGLLSFLVHGRLAAPLAGLDAVPPEDRPPLQVPFQSYHLMVALGGFFVAVTLFGLLMHWRRRLFETRWLLGVFVFAVAGAYAANQAGWVAAEVGRPAVDRLRLLRTPNALSKASAAGQVATSIVMFSVVYLLLFASGSTSSTTRSSTARRRRRPRRPGRRRRTARRRGAAHRQAPASPTRRPAGRREMDLQLLWFGCSACC